MIHLFYTDHSPALSYRVTEKLLQRPNQIRLESCITGTANAMDFQLISALGCLLSACDPGKNDFKIISDDRGYDATVAFWTKRGMPVTRITSCSVASSKTPAQAKKKRETDVISTTFQNRNAGYRSCHAITATSVKSITRQLRHRRSTPGSCCYTQTFGRRISQKTRPDSC